jgi:hypothetical protein
VPAELWSAPAAHTVAIRLEDPGHEMNPQLENSFPSRARMAQRGDVDTVATFWID